MESLKPLRLSEFITLSNCSFIQDTDVLLIATVLPSILNPVDTELLRAAISSLEVMEDPLSEEITSTTEDREDSIMETEVASGQDREELPAGTREESTKECYCNIVQLFEYSTLLFCV